MTRRDGFGLLAALWLLIAISGALLHLTLWARQRRLTAANAVETIQARAAAHAGLEHARAVLSRAAAGTGGILGGPDPWLRSDTLLAAPLVLGQAIVRVEVRDLASRLHLNKAEVGELRRFFAALGLPPERAEAVADAVADWRDADEERRPAGAEAADYLAAGPPRLPANAPFRSVEELQYVLGIDEALYTAAAAHLTVEGSGQINLNTAGRPVLLALEGFTGPAADLLEQRRAQGRPLRHLADLVEDLPPDDRQGLEARFPGLAARTTVEVRTVSARAVGQTGRSPVRVRAETLFTRVGGAVLESGRSVGP